MCVMQHRQGQQPASPGHACASTSHKALMVAQGRAVKPCRPAWVLRHPGDRVQGLA